MRASWHPHRDDVLGLQPPTVHDGLVPLGEHPAGRQGDVVQPGWVHRCPEQAGRRAVAGGGVLRVQPGEEPQRPGPVDGVVQPDAEVVRQPHEPGATQLRPGQAGAARGGEGGGGWQVHAGTLARATSAPTSSGTSLYRCER